MTPQLKVDRRSYIGTRTNNFVGKALQNPASGEHIVKVDTAVDHRLTGEPEQAGASAGPRSPGSGLPQIESCWLARRQERLRETTSTPPVRSRIRDRAVVLLGNVSR